MSPRSSARSCGLVIVVAMIAAGCSSEPTADAAIPADTGSETTAPVTDDSVTTAPVADESTAGDSTAPATEDSGAIDGTTTSTSEDLAPFPPLGDQTAAIAVTGQPLDRMPSQIPVTEPDNDPAIGQTAPEISGTDFAGSPVEIVADGTPRVVMFVAHWCPHCQREVPAVLDLIESGALPDGMELVIVSTAVRQDDENYPPQTWLQDEGWRGPIIRDSEEFDALLAFGAGGFPFSVYLNADHQVVTRSAGEIPPDIIEQLWLATATG